MNHSLSPSALRACEVPDQRMSASISLSPRALNCRRIAIFPPRNASAASSACFMAANALSLSASAMFHAACSAAFVNVSTASSAQNVSVLLLIDVDNTLVDRRAAYKAWAVSRFGASEAPWLIDADRDGYEARDLLADRIATRYDIDRDEILTDLRAGVRKPDRRIFALAAASVGRSLDHGGWMVGDNPELDIAGGAAAGLRTAWVSDGRPWPASVGVRPTLAAPTCAEALNALIRLPCPG